jgi:hypothetical protein
LSFCLKKVWRKNERKLCILVTRKKRLLAEGQEEM